VSWIREPPVVEPGEHRLPEGSEAFTPAWIRRDTRCWLLHFSCAERGGLRPSFQGGRARSVSDEPGGWELELLPVSLGFSPSWLEDSPALPRGRAEESRTGVRWVKQRIDVQGGRARSVRDESGGWGLEVVRVFAVSGSQTRTPPSLQDTRVPPEPQSTRSVGFIPGIAAAPSWADPVHDVGSSGPPFKGDGRATQERCRGMGARSCCLCPLDSHPPGSRTRQSSLEGGLKSRKPGDGYDLVDSGFKGGLENRKARDGVTS